jgi:hypothetical protein
MATIIAIPIGSLVGQHGSRFPDQDGYAPGNGPNGAGRRFICGRGRPYLVLIIFWPSLLDSRPQTGRQRITTQVRLLAVLLLVLFNLLLLAYLGLPAGDWLRDNLGFFGFLGNLVFVLSDFTQLLFPSLVGLAAILMAMSLGGRYGDEAIRRLEGTPARLVTAY